jgi:hypothetical protein
MNSLLNFFATLPHRFGDVVTGRSFEEKADEIINSAHSVDSRDQVILRIDELHLKCFAPGIRKLTGEKDQKVGRAAELCKEAKAIEVKLRNGSIPEESPGSTSFHLPKSSWSKLVFFLLLGVGVSLTIIEGLNVAWFLRFKTDSFPFAVLCSIPIFAFPVIEAVIVHNGLIAPRTRNFIMLIQGIVASAALAGYIYYSLVFADSSLLSVFAENPQGLSTEQLRMAFQILTSVLFSGICLLGADSLGVRKLIKNPKFREATEKIKALNEEAETVRKEAEPFIGKLERIHARKAEKILYCHQKFNERKAADSAHAESISKIRNS